MLAKLAFRNVRRSVRDYAIYFVTLVFGVAVFYAFNSVTGQSILFDLEDTATASVFEMTGQMLGMFSVVIACGWAFSCCTRTGSSSADASRSSAPTSCWA